MSKREVKKPKKVVEPKAEPKKVVEPKAEPKKVVEPKAEPKKVAEPKAEPKKVAEPKAEPKKAKLKLNIDDKVKLIKDGRQGVVKYVRNDDEGFLIKAEVLLEDGTKKVASSLSLELL